MSPRSRLLTTWQVDDARDVRLKRQKLAKEMEASAMLANGVSSNDLLFQQELSASSDEEFVVLELLLPSGVEPMELEEEEEDINDYPAAPPAPPAPARKQSLSHHLAALDVSDHEEDDDSVHVPAAQSPALSSAPQEDVSRSR